MHRVRSRAPTGILGETAFYGIFSIPGPCSLETNNAPQSRNHPKTRLRLSDVLVTLSGLGGRRSGAGHGALAAVRPPCTPLPAAHRVHPWLRVAPCLPWSKKGQASKRWRGTPLLTGCPRRHERSTWRIAQGRFRSVGTRGGGQRALPGSSDCRLSSPSLRWGSGRRIWRAWS